MTSLRTNVTFTIMIENDSKQDFFQLSLPKDTDILTLKAVIEVQSNLPTNNQNLYFKSKSILSNTATLKSLNVENDDIIVVKNNVNNQPSPSQSHKSSHTQSTDLLNPESQKLIEEKIAEDIDQKHINENYETALEVMPEAYGRIVMLYIPMEIEGYKFNAFIDTGAQTTIMSLKFAEKCGLMKLIDRRFQGIAKGVGTAKIIGRIHIASIKFGDIYLQSSFTIIDQDGIDFIFGLDMMRRYQAIIDLNKNVLRINKTEVQFLPEKDLPHLKQEKLQNIDEEAALQRALLEHFTSNKNKNNKQNKDIDKASTSPANNSYLLEC